MMAQWNTTFHEVPPGAQYSHAVWQGEVYKHLTKMTTARLQSAT